MRTITYIRKLCASCGKMHNVQIVEREELTAINETEFEFPARYEYCEEYDELTETEELMDRNFREMQKKYAEIAKKGKSWQLG